MGHVACIGDTAGVYKVLVGGNLTERGHLEDPVVDRRIILRWIFGKWDAGMDWIELAQDRDRWRALVNDLTKLQVPLNVGNFLTS